VGAWKLTVRDGSEVSHDSFEELGEAVAALRERAMEIRAGGPAEKVSTLKDFEPGEQVRARLELSGKGWWRKPIAGVDVRGDGSFIAFAGRIAREELDPTDVETPFDEVRKALERG
jgi:hypothetical protein